MKRPLRIFLEIIFAALVLLGIGLGGLTWRLSQGEIKLQNVLPDVQDLLASAAPGFQFRIHDALLELGEKGDLFAIRAYDVDVENMANQRVGNLQEILLGFSLRNFVMVSAVPSRIALKRPSMQLTRFEDRRIGFNLNPEKESPGRKMTMDEAARFIASAPAVLKRIQIQDAELQFKDMRSDLGFEAHNGLIVLERMGDGVSGTLSLDVKGEGIDQPIRGTLDYNPLKKTTQLDVAVERVFLDQLAAFLPQIPDALKVKGPLNVLVSAIIDQNFHPMTCDVHLRAPKGEIVYAPYWPDATQFSDLFATVAYDFTSRTASLAELSMKLGIARLTARGSLRDVPSASPEEPPSKKHVALTGLLENMPLNELGRYWPVTTSAEPRQWVMHQLSDGIATQSSLDLQADIGPDNTLDIRTLAGKIAFKDVTVDYLPPMPKVDQVTGHAIFDKDSFYITIEKGKLFDTQVRTSKLHIKDLTEHTQHIDIDLAMDGPISDALRTIAAQPLQYPQKFGLVPEQFAGNARTKLHLSFPLSHDLTLGQIDMTTEAALSGVLIKNAVKTMAVSSNSLTLHADTHHLHVAGPVKAADASAEVTWDEYFDDKAQYPTLFQAKGQVTPRLLEEMGFHADSYFKREASATIALKRNRQKETHMTVQANVEKADIGVEQWGIQKKSGSPGSLGFALVSQAGGGTQLSDINASWPQFRITGGSVQLDKNMALEKAALSGLQSGRTKADIAVTPVGADRLRISVKGEVVDLSGYWTDKTPSVPQKEVKVMEINLQAGKLYLDPDVPFQNIKAEMVMKGSELIRGQIQDQDSFVLKQTENAGGRQLYISAPNAGQVFQALDMTDSVRGGILTISGQSSAQNPSAISGAITLEKFAVVKAPVLARLINAFSPLGIIDLLNGGGLQFNKMRSEFVLEKPQTIRLNNGKMIGSSLGLNFSGMIYRDQHSVNLKGTIIPVQGLNKIVSKIPLLGQILTGIKGEGLIGATYTIKGPMADPAVRVNPLSVLTPGILRSIFFEGGGE